MLLGGADENVGTYGNTIVSRPASQRLGADDLFSRQVDDRLIDKLKFLFCKSPSELLIERTAATAKETKNDSSKSAGHREEQGRAGDGDEFVLPRFANADRRGDAAPTNQGAMLGDERVPGARYIIRRLA